MHILAAKFPKVTGTFARMPAYVGNNPDVKDKEEGEYSDETIIDSDEAKEDETPSKTAASPGKKSYNKTHIKGPNGLVLDVICGDLFTVPGHVSLAHCISRDCKMSKGIAKIFRWSETWENNVTCVYNDIPSLIQGEVWARPRDRGFQDRRGRRCRPEGGGRQVHLQPGHQGAIQPQTHVRDPEAKLGEHEEAC